MLAQGLLLLALAARADGWLSFTLHNICVVELLPCLGVVTFCARNYRFTDTKLSFYNSRFDTLARLWCVLIGWTVVSIPALLLLIEGTIPPSGVSSVAVFSLFGVAPLIVLYDEACELWTSVRRSTCSPFDILFRIILPVVGVTSAISWVALCLDALRCRISNSSEALTEQMWGIQLHFTTMIALLEVVILWPTLYGIWHSCCAKQGGS